MTDLQIQGVNMDLARKENENKLLNKSGLKDKFGIEMTDLQIQRETDLA